MAPPGYHEADTRAKLIEEAEALGLDCAPSLMSPWRRQDWGRAHVLRLAGADTQHQLMLSQAYEGLLLKMGEVVDARTTAELLQAIADKGKEVDDALDRLKALMT